MNSTPKLDTNFWGFFMTKYDDHFKLKIVHTHEGHRNELSTGMERQAGRSGRPVCGNLGMSMNLRAVCLISALLMLPFAQAVEKEEGRFIAKSA